MKPELSIAPMLGWTNRHCRYFHRLLTQHTLLYSEMVVTKSLINGDRCRLLAYNAEEHPLALQLGGADPVELAQCCRWAEESCYDEINLNIGCPSPKVQSGAFGAALMLQPQLVIDCVAAMVAATKVPISVKMRLGIVGKDIGVTLENFVQCLHDIGCAKFIIHARQADLDKLSPQQNRTLPPLNYARVWELQQRFPELKMVINGEIATMLQIKEQLPHVYGVMIGREAYHNPYLLANFDQKFYGSTQAPLTREQVILAFLPYIEEQLAQGVPLHAMTRHILGLFHGVPGAREWRRYLSAEVYKPGAGLEVVAKAMQLRGEHAAPHYVDE